MFFGNKLDVEGFDFSTKEGRAKAQARITELLETGSEKDKRAARIIAGLFGVMNDVPDEFALVHEVRAELISMEKKLTERSVQLYQVAKTLGASQYACYRFGAVDTYMVVAGGALMAAAGMLEKLEGYVATRSAEHADNKEKGGPVGSETPTEAPPAPPPF